MILTDALYILVWLTIFLSSFYWFYKSYKSNTDVQENHYEKALRYILDNKKRKAIEHLKSAIRANSNNIDAYVRLGNILREEGAASNALRVHKDLTLREELSKEDRYNVLKSISADLVQLKQDEKATQFLEQLLEISPKDLYATRELLRIYENTSSYKKAYQLLLKSETTVVKDREIRLAMYKIIEGLEKIEHGHEKEARIIFKDALKQNGKCEAAYILIGDSYWRENRKDEALEKWLDAARLIPEKAHFVFERIEKGWFETGEFYKLEDFYNSLLQKKPYNIKAIIALVKLKSKKGEIEEAIATLSDYLAQDLEDKEELVAHKIKLLEKQNKFKEASKLAVQYLNDHFFHNEHLYTCQNCHNVEDEPLGRCPKCGHWSQYL